MLGLRIKQLREELKLNQEELAKKLNISPSTIAMYETNRRQPNYDILENLSNIFNCSLDYLLGKSNIRNPEEIKFANAGGIDIEGLSEEEINEIQRQVEFMRWKKKDTKDEDK